MKKRIAEDITGAIEALIGADTNDYKEAAAEVSSVTDPTMNQALNTMNQSTNSTVSRIGGIMGQLGSTI